MTQPKYSTNRMGKGMLIIAFILALWLLSLFFKQQIEQQVNPNQAVSTTTDSSGRKEVVLKQNRHNHYVLKGKINGETVTFLLDTGATQVSIPESVAKRLSLERGIVQKVNTANGVIDVYLTRLKSLAIGEILLYDVRAHINPHMGGSDVLLGMSALKDIEFTQRNKQLILRY